MNSHPDSKVGDETPKVPVSEAVLAQVETLPTSPSLTQPSGENTDAGVDPHEILLGAEYKNLGTAEKNATVSVLGEDGEELRKVIATEVVTDPVQLTLPPPILQNSIVLIDPKFPEINFIIEAAKKRFLMVTAVIPKPNDGTKNQNLHPTTARLLEAGVHQVYEPPIGAKFDVMECAYHLKTIEAQQNLRFLGAIPCREASVDVADMLSALLGLRNGNDLGLAGARRDKGLMKLAVANAGLRVAKYARLTRSDGGDVKMAIDELELDYPIVVKTPRGWSTQDVYICNDLQEAVECSSKIVKSLGPDGRKTQYALMEEFITGEEFAVNLIASPTTPRGVQVTDIWRYYKIFLHGTMVNTWQSMVDPHDRAYSSLVRYGEGVCRAVGIKYGMAHIELKAEFDQKVGRWVNPAMIEVGARMAGGRKSVMAETTIPGWQPFAAMVDAHCGFPVLIPPSFRPINQATHVFIPSDKEGVVTKLSGDDFERLPTYHAHIMYAKIGGRVRLSKDIGSFAGHLWLIGDTADVERDAIKARNEFKVEVEKLLEGEAQPSVAQNGL